jgi:hypothetical protein
VFDKLDNLTELLVFVPEADFVGHIVVANIVNIAEPDKKDKKRLGLL